MNTIDAPSLSLVVGNKVWATKGFPFRDL
jgi:hypothetical protein